MVSTLEVLNDNDPISPGTSATLKKPSARVSPCKYTESLDVKQKTAIHRLGADKPERKSIRKGSILWYIIPKRRRHTKTNHQVKKLFMV